VRWYTLRKFFWGAYPPLCIVRFSGATLIEDVETDRGVRVVETLNAYLFHNGITTTRKQVCAAQSLVRFRTYGDKFFPQISTSHGYTGFSIQHTKKDRLATVFLSC